MSRSASLLIVIVFLIIGFSGCVSGTDKTEEVVGIVENYAATHTYLEEDFFLCGDFAVDVWNIITTRGLNATIRVGNVNESTSMFTDYNHVWVTVEVRPGEWLAFETTTGYSVSREQNPLYYEGASFDSLADFREFNDLLKLRNFQARRVKKEVGISSVPCDEYNAAVILRDELQRKLDIANQTNQTSAENLADLQLEVDTHQKLADILEINCVGALDVYEGELGELADIDERIVAVLERVSG